MCATTLTCVVSEGENVEVEKRRSREDGGRNKTPETRDGGTRQQRINNLCRNLRIRLTGEGLA